MPAIWHDHGQPSFFGFGPRFSFFDVADIVAQEPQSHAEWRAELQRWERRLGGAFYQDNARRAWEIWQMKRPWWLV